MKTHDYYTRGKKHVNDSNDDDPLTNTKLEENISHKHQCLKDIIIKRLQDENNSLQSKCESLEDKVTHLE